MSDTSIKFEENASLSQYFVLQFPFMYQNIWTTRHMFPEVQHLKVNQNAQGHTVRTFTPMISLHAPMHLAVS